MAEKISFLQMKNFSLTNTQKKNFQGFNEFKIQ